MTTKAKLGIVLMWGLIFFGVFLRTLRADKFPTSPNDDGVFYVWTGNSVLDNPLRPISHSIFTTNPSLIWWSQFKDFRPDERFGMKIVRPWFDHPPLATLLIALPARLLGYTDFSQLPAMLVRYPALLASIATMLFAFLVARRWFGASAAYLALVFLATTPYFVFAQRQSYMENFIVPTFLASLWFLLRFEDYGRRFDLWWAMGLAAAVGWMKIPAFAFPFMVAGWLFHQAKKREGMIALGVSFVSPAVYALYGFFIDKAAFFRTLVFQGERGAFPGSFLDTLVNPHFYQPFLDGWYIFGLVLAIALALSGEKRAKIFGWFFAGWVIALFLVSGKMNNSPWYKYPLIPFMAMALGVYSRRFLEEHTLLFAVPFFVFGIAGLDLLQVGVPSMFLRISIVGVVGMFSLPFMFPKNPVFRRIGGAAAGVMLLAILTLNTVISIRYPFVFCQQNPCQRSEKIVVPSE